MKKLLLITMLTAMSVVGAFAQEKATLPMKSNDAVVDSLVTQLNKLQRDYDYLSCDFELNKLQDDLDDFSSEVSIKSNAVLLNCYHSSFNYALYKAYNNYYQSCLDKLETLKIKVTSVAALIISKMYMFDFTEEERKVLLKGCNLLENQLEVANNALNYYKVVLDMYMNS